MKHYVVTGATGHLGNNLVDRLLLAGDGTVSVFALPHEDVSMFAGKGVDIRYGDVLDFAFLLGNIAEGDIVFHLAGIVDISGGDKSRVYEVNIRGTENVLKACLQQKVEKLVYTSSVHVVEPAEGNAVMTEPTEFDENKIVGDYAKSKTVATRLVFDYIRRGLPAVVVYPSGIVGPKDYKTSSIGTLLLDIANGKLNVSLKGAGYNFVDVRDCANGVYLAALRGRVGEGYLLSGNRVSISQIMRYVRFRMGRSARVFEFSVRLAAKFAPMLEKAALKRGKKPLFTAYSLYTITCNANFSAKKAQEELGYSVRGSMRTIFDTLEWYAAARPELLTARARARLLGKRPGKKPGTALPRPV